MILYAVCSYLTTVWLIFLLFEVKSTSRVRMGDKILISTYFVTISIFSKKFIFVWLLRGIFSFSRNVN